MRKNFKSALAKSSLVSLVLAMMLVASPSQATLVWTRLTLINGWKYHTSYHRVPMVAIDSEGIVHFRGAMREATGANGFAFQLPAALRPQRELFVSIGLSGGKPGRLIIRPSGSVTVASAGLFSDAQAFTSLDGVTFSQY